MADLEKVLNGLKCCAEDVNEFGDCLSNDCPYKHKQSCCSALADDALDLLKEQKPVLLKNQHKPGGHFINANSPWKSKCPRCGKKVEGRQTRFCKYCGQAVKWDG